MTEPLRVSRRAFLALSSVAAASIISPEDSWAAADLPLRSRGLTFDEPPHWHREIGDWNPKDSEPRQVHRGNPDPERTTRLLVVYNRWPEPVAQLNPTIGIFADDHDSSGELSSLCQNSIVNIMGIVDDSRIIVPVSTETANGFDRAFATFGYLFEATNGLKEPSLQCHAVFKHRGSVYLVIAHCSARTGLLDEQLQFLNSIRLISGTRDG